jgi:hypothetical protein
MWPRNPNTVPQKNSELMADRCDLFGTSTARACGIASVNHHGRKPILVPAQRPSGISAARGLAKKIGFFNSEMVHQADDVSRDQPGVVGFGPDRLVTAAMPAVVS